MHKRAIELRTGDVVRDLVGREQAVSSVRKHATNDQAWSVLLAGGDVIIADADKTFEVVRESDRTDVAKLPKTKQVLWEMITENTGRHFLDSGGAYGRHWERNQGRDFEKELDTSVRFDAKYREIAVTINLYHWLESRLEYDERLDALFHRFARRPSQKDSHWLQSMEDFLPFLARFGFEFHGIYGEGEPFVTYTYNDENCLSQDVQFLYFNAESPDGSSDTYVLLQVHNGCDARGGLTQPRAFRVCGDGDETCVFDYNRVNLGCDGKPHTDALCPNRGSHLKGFGHCSNVHPGDYHRWDSDGGGWSDVGDGNVPDALRNFRDLEFARLGDRDLEKDDPENDEDVRLVSRWRPGILVVTEDGRGLCPVCGGELSAGWF